jgi:DNA (cytosine-5)-methyltransferase 1
LQRIGKPYIIENVPGAPLTNAIMLCGTMFNLRVMRHRLFECEPYLWLPPAQCKHIGRATGSGSRRRKLNSSDKKTLSLKDGFSYVTICGNDYLAEEGREAMGIPWMIKKELSQAIPPAYTEWLGRQMLELIQ